MSDGIEFQVHVMELRLRMPAVRIQCFFAVDSSGASEDRTGEQEQLTGSCCSGMLASMTKYVNVAILHVTRCFTGIASGAMERPVAKQRPSRPVSTCEL